MYFKDIHQEWSPILMLLFVLKISGTSVREQVKMGSTEDHREPKKGCLTTDSTVLGTMLSLPC